MLGAPGPLGRNSFYRQRKTKTTRPFDKGQVKNLLSKAGKLLSGKSECLPRAGDHEFQLWYHKRQSHISKYGGQKVTTPVAEL